MRFQIKAKTGGKLPSPTFKLYGQYGFWFIKWWWPVYINRIIIDKGYEEVISEFVILDNAGDAMRLFFLCAYEKFTEIENYRGINIEKAISTDNYTVRYYVPELYSVNHYLDYTSYDLNEVHTKIDKHFDSLIRNQMVKTSLQTEYG